MKQYYLYILASEKYGTLYIGVTDNIIKRIEQHKSGKGSVFTSKYKVDKLVYYEILDSLDGALLREKQLKEWKRDWKIKLIEEKNINWEDLSFSL